MKKGAKVWSFIVILTIVGLMFSGLIITTSATSEKTTINVLDSSPWFTIGCHSNEKLWWWSHQYEDHDYISTYVGGMSRLGGSPSEHNCWARFKPYLSHPGKYEVYAYFYACKNTSTKVPFTVKYDGGSTTIKVNQYRNVNQYRSPSAWKEEYLGTWYFKAGQDTYVEVTDATGERYDEIKGLTIGAIKFVKVFSDEKSIKFKTGDFVRVIADAGWNIRTEPKLGDEYKRIPPSPLPKGSEGQIMEHQDNGIFNDGYYWWYLRFGDYEGWCAEDGLEKSETALQVAKPVLTSPLKITPEKDKYYVGDTIRAEFTVKNVGGAPITLDKLLVGGRFNDGKLPNGEFPDFTPQSTTLPPNGQYRYMGTLTLTQPGNYHFFVAYYIGNPTPEEKKLLDENNWNTSVDLGEGLTDEDRIKKIFTGPSTLEFANLNSEGELSTSLYKVIKQVLDVEQAKMELEGQQEDILFNHIDNLLKQLDPEQQDKDLIIKDIVKDDALSENEEFIVGFLGGLSGVGITLLSGVPAPFLGVGAKWLGLNIGEQLILKDLHSATVKKPEIGRMEIVYDETPKNKIWINIVLTDREDPIFITIPVVSKLLRTSWGDYICSPMWCGLTCPPEAAERALCPTIEDVQVIGLYSPGELRVYDSHGRVTGLVKRKLNEEIPNSAYFNNTVIIFFSTNSYRYEVVGTDTGTYSLSMTSAEELNVIDFTATDIPTSTNAIHQYTIDWDALSQGEKGVTVKIDSDGDGVFEKTVIADNELSQEELTPTLPVHYTFVTMWPELPQPWYFDSPHGIAVDSSGNVFVADTSNDRIQKFDSNGKFITKWGSEGTGDGEFSHPGGIAVDSTGNVFVADALNDRIQKFDSYGNFITKWGSESTGDGEFNCPQGIAVDSSGYVYVADAGNGRIQKFDSVGNFITKWGSSGSGDGEFRFLIGIAVDSSGYVYVASDSRIQKFDSNGKFITKWGSCGSGDGEFSSPDGIAVDSSGNVFVADTVNDRLQKFDSNGKFITKWGSEGTGDGEFNWPKGVAVDSNGNVLVADTLNDRIQKFDSNGKFITKWGSCGSGDDEFCGPAVGIAVDSSGYVYIADPSCYNNRIQKFDSNGNFITKWGSRGTGDGEFSYSYGIVVDSNGNVFVADTLNDRIQKFDSNGKFITKWGSEGTGDGEFNWPQGIAVDSSGYVYVADAGNGRIQKFDTNGKFITKWDSEGTGDGDFMEPFGIAVDSGGNVYVADTFNNRIQKFNTNGKFITKWGSEGTGDGEFSYSYGIAVDSSGNVFVADSWNHRIQKFDSAGKFITKWGSHGTGDGEFQGPMGIAVDSSGYVHVADSGNNRIQKFAPGNPPIASFTYSPEKTVENFEKSP